jgi:phytoene dehydrogenase-like protein
MFGKSVLILEKHYVVGGLNSFYARKGRKFDVGLHAVTNFPSTSSGKTSPLLRACRQLRIPFESLNLHEQSSSRISFGNNHIRFNNEFSFFLNEINENFPKEKDRFQNFLQKMQDFDAYSITVPNLSTRSILKDEFTEPLLGEMLLCPTSYYGSAQENDIDFATFTMLFDAIFKQGLARPSHGIRAILDPIVQKIDEAGVKRLMNNAVKKIKTNKDRATEIVMENEDVYSADHIISTCGLVETEELLTTEKTSPEENKSGNFSVIETISVFKGKPTDFGWEETVIFYNDDQTFRYEKPKESMDSSSGVICIPENYQDPHNQKTKESRLRITNPANFDKWSSLEEPAYIEEKARCEEIMLEKALEYLPNGQLQKKDFSAVTILKDTFTPRTIKKYTNHTNGALYGSPVKSRSGSSLIKNLYLAGTDQGYIGIVGAMLGGIAVANNRILRPS